MEMINRVINKVKREVSNLQVVYLRNKYLSRFKYSKKIILLLLPNDDSINGGILSITSIFNEFNALKNIHLCDVIAATHSYHSNEYFLRFSKFKNDMLVFDLKKVLRKIEDIKEIHIHIPELLLKEFIESFENEWSSIDKCKLLNIDALHINILNQNDMLMPDSKYIEKVKELLTENVTMTVAHKKYATIEKRNKYKVSLHYLSAWLNPVPYVIKGFDRKDNIILFSPDELSRLNIRYHFTKQDLIDMLRLELPDFEIIVIANLSYDDYKSLVTKSRFMVTLGEGLDGYFIETVLSGGIAFAVYNDKFFTEDYRNLPTVYESIDDMFKKIVGDIDYYNKETKYSDYNKVLKNIVEIEYSYEKYQNRVKNYILGNYDFK